MLVNGWLNQVTFFKQFQAEKVTASNYFYTHLWKGLISATLLSLILKKFPSVSQILNSD